jgi:ABC-2 type transport system ATP-binding protein
VIRKGEIILVEDKVELMHKLGQKQLTLHLLQPLTEVPQRLAAYGLALANGGSDLVYTYDTEGERGGIASMLKDLDESGIRFRDLQTDQKSLEDIFVGLVREEA